MSTIKSVLAEALDLCKAVYNLCLDDDGRWAAKMQSQLPLAGGLLHAGLAVHSH